MPNSVVPFPSAGSAEYWPSLKQAIAASSGFQRWLQERFPLVEPTETVADSVMLAYLRQTLETLAY